MEEELGDELGEYFVWKRGEVLWKLPLLVHFELSSVSVMRRDEQIFLRDYTLPPLLPVGWVDDSTF